MKKFILLLHILIIMGCTIPDEFTMPNWTTTFKLIFINDSYDIEDLAEEDSSLVVIQNVLNYQDQFSEIQLLGDLEIELPAERYYDISVQEVMPDSLEDALQPSTYMIIPAFIMEPNLEVLEPYEEFSSISFSSGHIILTIVNNTAIGIGNSASGYPLLVEVLDSSNSDLLKTVELEDIPPGNGSITEVIDLSGIIFPNTISILISGGSTGSNGEQVFIDDELFDSTIDVIVDLNEIYAEYVTDALIPEQEIDPITDNYLVPIEYPEIIGDFTLNGYSEINITVNSVIPGFIDIDLKAVNSYDSLEVWLYPFSCNQEHSLSIAIEPGINQFCINSDEFNLNELFTILPDNFHYTIYTSIGDTLNTYDLSSSDEISTEFNFSADIQIQTDDDGIWIIPRGDGEILISDQDTEEFDQQLYNAFQSGKLNFLYLNNTGMELSADVMISTDSLLLKQELYNFTEPPAAEITIFHVPELQITYDSQLHESNIVIEQQDLDPFLADRVFSAVRLFLFSDGSQPLSNGVYINGELELEILVSDDLINEKGD